MSGGPNVRVLAFFAVLATALALSPNAHAQATIPVKAIAPACTLASCPNYFWIGGGLGGVGTNADIIGAGLDNSVFADGMMPFGEAEWFNWNGTFLLGADAGIGYQFAQPDSIDGNNLDQSEAIGWVMGEAGGSLSQLFGGSTPVTVLGALQTDLLTLYGMAGPVFADDATLPGFGAGAKYLVGKNSQLDIKYIYANDQQNSTKNVQLVLISWKYGFAP